jgi:hypothetical protein
MEINLEINLEKVKKEVVRERGESKEEKCKSHSDFIIPTLPRDKCKELYQELS